MGGMGKSPALGLNGMPENQERHASLDAIISFGNQAEHFQIGPKIHGMTDAKRNTYASSKVAAKWKR